MKTLTEYELYVPTRESGGRRIGARKLARFRRELLDYFGGLTDTRHRNLGLWKVAGTPVRDEIVVWRLLSDRGKSGERFIRAYKRKLEKELGQEQILVVRRSVRRL